jgi:2-deoxy-D-gluconate 3-dehydrogenase
VNRSAYSASKHAIIGLTAGRFGEPEDIVGSVIFLASRAADYVTGHQLIVDGGWYAR